MTHLIDKDALAAEIERRITAYQKNFDKADNKIARISTDGRIQSLKSILSFLNTLEVKEVDLEKEIETCLKRHSMLAVGKKDFTDIAKHFFEIGLQVAQKG